MPYASPSATTTTISNDSNDFSPRSPGRVGGHRRSRSVNDANIPSPSSSSASSAPSSAQHTNTAAFSPLAGIPRRSRTSGNLASVAKPRGPVFDFTDDNAEESQSSSGDSVAAISTSQVTSSASASLNATNGGSSLPAAAAGLRVDTANLAPAAQEDHADVPVPAIPFPQLSPPLSGAPASAPPAPVAAPTNAIPFPETGKPSVYSAIRSTQTAAFPSSGPSTPMRSPSSPIIRKSNGSIVKPSLKSSLSSGNIPALNSPAGSSNGLPNTTSTSRNYTRSAPSTPSLKAVHFTEKDSVVLFEKSQRPVAVSLGSANGAAPIRPGIAGLGLSGGESETETERESDGVLGLFGVSSSSGYPFPSVGSSSSRSGSGLNASGTPKIEIAKAKSSNVAGVPGTLSPSMLQSSEGRVHLESVTLVTPAPSSSAPPPSPSAAAEGTGDEILKGTLLVENVSFGKSVFVRFTLDEWQTTSEVGATYVDSLPISPSALSVHSRSRSEPYLSRSHARSRSPSPGPSKQTPRQWDRFSFSINLSSVRHLHTRRLFLVVRYNPQSWGPNAEFWDNNEGKNYCFVFEREKRNPAASKTPLAVDTSSTTTAATEGLGLSGLGGDKKSSMPVSPSARLFKSQMDAREDAGAAEMERAMMMAKDRPVPRLPGPGIGKSASAPALAVLNQQQPQQRDDEDVNRPRSASAGSYPAIQLKLSNYISPTTTKTASPIVRPPPISTAPAPAPVTSTISSSSASTGAPLSPPASPVADRVPSPTPSTSSISTIVGSESVTPNPTLSSATITPAREKGRLSTPPESANTSPEANLVPLPPSASSSSPSSSDSDRENLRLRMAGNGTGGNYYKRSMTNPPQYYAQKQQQKQQHRAPAPQGLNFAGRFAHHTHDSPHHHPHHAPESSMGDAHDHHFAQHHHHHKPQHAHPHAHVAHQPQQRHQTAKFTVGTPTGGATDSNNSSPPSSSTGTPTQPGSGHSSPFDPTSFRTLSQIQTNGSSTLLSAALNGAAKEAPNGAGANGNPFNNAPPEFLQKFCFFGSPEPSPTHTHPPAPLFGSAPSGINGNGALNGPIMFGGEVLPGATVGMGSLSSLMVADAGLPYMYAAGGAGSASPLRGDMRASATRV